MARRLHQIPIQFRQLGTVDPVTYTCGWCGSLVGSASGADPFIPSGERAGLLRLCPNCGYPSFQDVSGNWTPAVPYGETVANLPDDIAELYGEARDCVSIGANHAAVMVGRKVLMHVAVQNGAEEGKGFVEYVDYLEANNLVPPGTRAWVDEIRQVGNDANHEIFEISVEEAKGVVDFVTMLLKLLYEFPAKGAASVAARAAKDAGQG